MSFIEKLKSNHYIYKIGVWVNILYYDFIVDTFIYLQIKLRKIGLLPNYSYDNMRRLKGKYCGKRCFIIATGPSLTMDDLHKIRNEYTIGVNSLVKVFEQMGYVPTYLGIQDGNVFDKIGRQIEDSGVGHVFITNELYHRLKRKDNNRYIRYCLYSLRHSRHNDIRPLTSGFSDDTSNCVYDGYSVTYSMLQIAVYMGFTEIYLLGCDCSYDTSGGKQHFVESGHFDKNAASVGERMIYAYTVAKKLLEKKHPEVKVYNATRGGMLEVFPRKTLDELDDLK